MGRRKGFLRTKYISMYVSGLIGWVVVTVGSLADSILAGLFLSEEAVSAVELVTPVFSLFLFVCYFIGVGTSTLYMQAVGAFDSERANKMAGMGLIISVISGIVLDLLMVSLEDAFFSFYDAGFVVEELAREYYRCFILMTFLYPVYWLLYYLAAADGDDRITTRSDIVNAVSNQVLSLILVRVMGIRGLAFGTVGGLFLGAIVLLPHFRQLNTARFRPHLNWASVKEMFISSSASSLVPLYIAVVDLFFNRFIILHYGSEYLPAYAVVNLILSFAGIFSTASSAAGPFVSVGCGEQNPAIIRAVMRYATRSTAILGLILTASAVLLSNLIPKLYGISDPQIIADAVFAARLLAVSYLPTCFMMEWTDYSPRVRKPGLGNWINLIYMLLSPFAFALPFSLLWGFRGLVIGFFFTPVAALLAGVGYALVRYGRKQVPSLLPETEDTIFLHELTVCSEEILAMRNTIEKELKSCGVSSRLITQITLMVEETFMLVQERNKDQTILASCSLLVSPAQVRLITWDNGVIFDITDSDNRVQSLRSYIAACLMERSTWTRTYLQTVSFNRNNYIWLRQSDEAEPSVSAPASPISVC